MAGYDDFSTPATSKDPYAGFSTPAVVPQQNGPQPSIMQTLAASPVGRFTHDALVAPAEGLVNMLHPVDFSGVEKPYANALAAQQNRPGYAEARAEADARLQGAGNQGFTSQVTAPFNPSMSGLGGLLLSGGNLNEMNASSDAQASAQKDYQQQNPIKATTGQLLGGLMAIPEGASPNLLLQSPKPVLSSPKAYTPSIADLKAAAKDAYAKVDSSGLTISNDAMNGLGDSLQDKFVSRLDPVLHPDATAAYNRVAQYATDGTKGDSSASFTDLDNLRRVVQDSTGAVKPADKFMARQILDHVDDFVGGLKPSDLDTTAQDQMRADLVSATSQKGQIAKQIKSIEQNNPGALISRGAAGADTRATYMGLHQQLQDAEAARQTALGTFQNESDLLNAGPQDTINSLNSARDYWSRASQAQLIQSQIDKAGIKASANYSQSGMENALRQQFKSLALNDRAMARLTPEVQQSVKDVAAGSPVGNVLRAVGKFAPHGPVATGAGMGIGYMLGGPEGGMASLALPAIGEAARMGATAMTRGAAQRALTTAAVGRSVPLAAAPTALAAPAITSASRIPYGLFASGFPMLANQSQQ